MKINGEYYLPMYKWVYNGPFSSGMLVMIGFRKIEKQEDVDNRIIYE